ncbi:MAG TPA: pyrroline-5-carboxylate reductase [Dehalococcoidales bacterium]|nr:pyrroline-5-carboxylate reductase [Dehalococcoidales bacterium]
MKIAFIGGGNMGEAILSRILERKLSTRKTTFISDISESRRQSLKQTYRVNTTDNNRSAAVVSEVVLLAIKPQNLTQVMAELNEQLKPSQLVLSIAAGTKIETLYRGLRHNSIVRAIPNTPAQVGAGITVWTATAEVNEQQKGWARSILGAIGEEIYVADEKYLDMATAVSGSSPAYFFLFMETLVKAAVDIGLPRDMAEKLVLQTMLGSSYLLQKSGKPPAELRRMVTSPGGTTAEALLQFDRGGLGNLVKQAVTAAYEKAKKLGNEQK